MNGRVHQRVARFNRDLNISAQQNLQCSFGLRNNKLQLYSADQILRLPTLEYVFKGYFVENPISRVLDMDEEENRAIEVEYIYGAYNDVNYIVEFDKRARIDLEERKGD